MNTFNNGHLTTVSIQVTQIKALDEATNEVVLLDCFGRLNLTESKQVAKAEGLTFISKQLINNKHEILTSELIKLV